MLAFIGAVLAQEAVSLEYVRAGQIGLATPSLRVIANQPADDLSVRVECGGKVAQRAGPAGAGDRIELPLEVAIGTHACRGTLSVVTADGEGEMPLSFSVTMHPALGIRLQPGSLDLAAHTVTVVLDRPSSKVEVETLGIRGARLGSGLLPVSVPAGTPIMAGWKQAEGEVLKLRVRGFDADGFYGEIELVPWSYSVPHDDVVFGTNLATIDPAEAPKLQQALADAKGVVEKYGADVIIKLYVAGHTDTVGDAASNQELSMKRAKAIAEWFGAHGFPGDIFYQGYGEGDLAVETGDQVDEPRNRRAAYILAAKPPEAQGGSGDYGWKRL